MSLRGKFTLSMLAFILLAVLSASTARSAAPAGPTTPIPPGPKPTPTRPVTPTPTLAPTPTILYFQQSDRFYYPPQTPTPLAPPPASPYRLQPWTETRALELVRKIVIDAHDREVPGPSGGRPGLAIANEGIRLSALEALYRYPQSKDAAALGWRVALSNTILGSRQSDAWIAAQIADILNRRLAVPDNLNDYLARYGFRARIGAGPVPRVFNDGREAQVWIVETADETGGLFMLLSKTATGKYECIPLNSVWGAHWYFELSAGVENFLGDDLPVIVTRAGIYSGTMSQIEMGLFHWNGKKMVEIGQGQIRSTGIEGNRFEVTFLPAGMVKVSDPQVGIGFQELTYQWNGQSLKLVSDRYDLSGEWFSGREYAYLNSLAQGDYQPLETALTSTVKDENLLKNGPSAPDFLRFLLAETQVLQGKDDLARQTLQAVANSTADPTHPALRRAAQVFLRNASNPGGWLKGCLEANRLIGWYAHVYPAYSQYLPSDIQKSLFGHDLVRYLPCQAGPLFQSFINGLTGSQAGDPLKVLADSGIRLRFSARLDQPGDQEKIWLVQFETAGDIIDPQTWLVISSGGQARAVPFDRAPAGYLPAAFPPLERIQLPGSARPAFLLSYPGWVTLFRVNSSNGNHHIETLINETRVGNLVQLDDRQKPPSVVVESRDSCLSRRLVYVWDDSSGRYVSRDLPDWLLFDRRQPDEAAAAIPEILSSLKKLPTNENCGEYLHLEAARLSYLLAVSQELSGDPAAAGSYAAVWRDYHDTNYALMAKAKSVP